MFLLFCIIVCVSLVLCNPGTYIGDLRPWRHDWVIGKFAEVGKLYDIMVTQLTANGVLEFEL